MKKALLFIFVLATILSWQIAKAENLFSKDLYFGIQNDSEVTKLQEFLTSEGVYSGPITGNFFSLTLKAVKDYQTREGISPAAGYFGPISRAKANTGLSTQIEASNAQAVSETGTTPTPPIVLKTTTDIVNTMQTQLDALLQQVALLQQQLQTQQQTQQTVQNLQTQVAQQTQTLQQIQQNTTPSTPAIPASAPTLVSPPLGSLTLSLAASESSSQVVPGGSFYTKFYFEPDKEKIELRQISFGFLQKGPPLDGTYYVKLNDNDWYHASYSVSNAQNQFSFPTDGATRTIQLPAFPTLPVGVKSSIAIEIRIPGNATAGDSYQVTNFNIVKIKRVITNDIIDPNTIAVSGPTVSVIAE